MGRIEAQRPAAHLGGELAGTPGAIAGEIDGVRPWREGDGDKAVHWASTLRSGELVVHDHRHDAERRRDRARPHGNGRSRRRGRPCPLGARAGTAVRCRRRRRDRRRRTDADRRHCAGGALDVRSPNSGRSPTPGTSRAPRQPVEPETTARPSARWWAAAATFVALVTLHGALGYGPLVTVVVGAVVVDRRRRCRRVRWSTGTPVPAAIRLVVGARCAGELPRRRRRRRSVHRSAVDVARTAPAGARDPRAAARLRVPRSAHGAGRPRHLGRRAACTRPASESTTRSAGGCWRGWCASACRRSRLALPTAAGRGRGARDRCDGRACSRSRACAAVALGVAPTIALLAVVPIPDGPARLTLPTFIENAQDIARSGRDRRTGWLDPRQQRHGRRLARSRRASRRLHGLRAVDGHVGARRAERRDRDARARAASPTSGAGRRSPRSTGDVGTPTTTSGTRRGGPNIDIPRALGDTADDRSCRSTASCRRSTSRPTCRT